MTKQTRRFHDGQQVTYNDGFRGVIVRYYSEGMVEVETANQGRVCIPEEDAKPLEN